MAKMVCSTSTSSLPWRWRWSSLTEETTKTRLSLSFHNFQRRPKSLSQSQSLQTKTKIQSRRRSFCIRAVGKNNNNNQQLEEEEEEQQVEEDIPWIQEKALDFVEFSGSVTQAIPGPRVGQTSMPWFVAVPLAFLGITFLASLVKTFRNFTSPRAQRRKLISKNAMLNKSIDQLFLKGRDAVDYSALEDIVNKTGFGMEEVLRKYLRYTFNDKPFNGDTVADLIQLRKASMLTDSQVAEILNDISRRIVKDKGPVVMDASGYTERGFKRKLAVQALFGKVFYLSELPEFCSRDSSLIVKEIFGVTDEDADKLRIQTLSYTGDIETLEKMIGDGSDFEDTFEDNGES